MMSETSSDERTPGLASTGSPDWGSGFRAHVESLVVTLEDEAARLGPGLFASLRGGLVVSLYGGKGFSVTFDGQGNPHVERAPLDLKPDPGLYLRIEMWALESVLNPTREIDDPEEFFVAAGLEFEGDISLLSRLAKLGVTQNKSAANARIGALLGHF